jgi:hypothetical protein
MYTTFSCFSASLKSSPMAIVRRAISAGFRKARPAKSPCEPPHRQGPLDEIPCLVQLPPASFVTALLLGDHVLWNERRTSLEIPGLPTKHTRGARKAERGARATSVPARGAES